MQPETELVHFDAAPGDPFQPTTTPIYQTATFRLPSASAAGVYDYTRSGNPTRSVLEKQLARLEGGDHALAFSSGMAAITAVVSLMESGQEVLVCDDLYGGTYRLLTRILPRLGVAARFVDATRLDRVEAALSRRTRLLFFETPTNPLLEINDIQGLTSLARRNGTLVAVDNSLMSPWLQKPLTRDADLVVHSATKFLGGHGDVTAGAVITNNPEVADQIAFYRNAVGTALAPFESWLLLRGLKTLGVRVERQQETAIQVAQFLARHPAVARVHYPGLSGHPNRETHSRQARGNGSVISFETGRLDVSEKIVQLTTLFNTTVSFGSLASSVSLPSRMSHASISDGSCEARKFPSDLVRISVGIEHSEDLIADLSRAFELAAGMQQFSKPCDA